MFHYIFKEKKLLGIVIPMVFWGFMYKLFFLNKYATITWERAIQGFKEVLLFNQENHLYYLQITILIYLVMPILQAFVQNLDRKVLEYTLSIWFILGIGYPTISDFWPFYLVGSIGRQYMINMTFSAIGYCLLGYYLKAYPLKKSWARGLILFGLTFVFFATFLGSLYTGDLYTLFLEGMSLGVCLYGAGMFSLLLHRQTIARKSIRLLSGASFTTYLTHVFFLDLFIRKPWIETLNPYPLFRMSVSLFILLASTITLYQILKRLPLVNQWLI